MTAKFIDCVEIKAYLLINIDYDYTYKVITGFDMITITKMEANSKKIYITKEEFTKIIVNWYISMMVGN